MYNKNTWADQDLITADKLNHLESGVYDTNTQVNNLSVGGRNLFLGTSDFSGSSNWVISGSTIKNIYQGLDAIQSNIAWSGPKYNNSVLETQGVILSTSDTFIMSAWVRNTGTTPTSMFFYGDTLSLDSYKVVDLPANSGWVRISSQPFQFTKTSGLSGTMRFEPNSDSTNGYVQQVGLKLEKGNIATDWTPAPEDSGTFTSVTLTGNQTVSGDKSFTGNVSIGGASMNYGNVPSISISGYVSGSLNVRKQAGMVSLESMDLVVQKGATFSLPSGYYPRAQLQAPITGQNSATVTAAGYMTIGVDGSVKFDSLGFASGNATAYVNVHFVAQV